MAVMEIGGWETQCSECHRSTSWDEEGHVVILGYDMEVNGTPGCGAKWTGVRFVYMSPVGPSDPRVDSDYYPQWMKELPLV